jgi:hypothetical protein
METDPCMQARFQKYSRFLDERSLRLVAAADARELGYGGVSRVARASGLSRTTILRGIEELASGAKAAAPGRIRKEGGGRKRADVADGTLKRDLEGLVEPTERGDPENPLRWTTKSVRTLSRALKEMSHDVCPVVVARLLRELGYSLQANRKTLEGASHPDRNAQFEHINARVREFLAAGDPVVSVDTKKKEIVGDFKNGGREWRPQGEPERVRVHDFIIPELGRAAPYGVYDLAQNAGWISVGTDHDTSAFAVESVRRWWRHMGAEAYRGAKRLLITADCGGSNGYRVRQWKWELQGLADETGIAISVCHFPPGTSKWNKIEHRLFSFVSMNWRGKPLTSYATIINLIAGTTTAKGLKVRSGLDENQYPAGVKFTKKQMESVHVTGDSFHGEWNYTISPAEDREL